ncbi:DMT family transporter [bacterium]|nr:DMT family transporter [bacterium]
MSVSRSPRGRGIGLALLSALGFSTLGIFATNLYAAGFSVPQTLAWRFAIASAFLWATMAVRRIFRGATSAPEAKAPPSVRPSDRLRRFALLLLLALFGFTPQAGLFFLTVKLLAPGITSLLLYLYPAFVLLLGAVFMRRRPSRGQLAALVLSFLGCLATFFAPGAYPLGGLLLGVFVALCYGAYLVAGEKILADYDPIFATAVIMTVACAVYWGIVAASGSAVRVPGNLAEWGGVACIALIATVLPITTLFAAIKRLGAADLSLVSTIEPVCTVLLSAALRGERLTANRIAGGLLIVGGVVALQRLGMRDQRRGGGE